MKFNEQVKSLWDVFKKSATHLLYPAKCLHCHILLPPCSQVFCSGCATLLQLLDPMERCSICFNPLSEPNQSICHECLQYRSFYKHMGSVFDYEGPAASLVKRLKYGNQPYLARGMAAFLVIQLDRLKWPMPDVLVPVPLSFTHWLERGYNQSALLAEEMGQLLNRPVWDSLKRRNGDFSQAALTLDQRKALDGSRFKLKLKYSLEDKVILVIDDVLTSGSTLQRCAETLSSKGPASLYALTFCRT